MMNALQTLNLKVVIVDGDFYALQAINSYLAWDRRTRVTHMSQSYTDLIAYLDKTALAEQPNVILIDADSAASADTLRAWLETLLRRIDKLVVICLGRIAVGGRLEAAAAGGARAFFVKDDVRLQIAWAIVHVLDKPFVVSRSAASLARTLPTLSAALILPRRREYPELTERIRQAIELCVVSGMPAQLAADEMGISLNTVRSYIKEGYRILESYDDTTYPDEMSPAERAFMRLTSLDNDDPSMSETPAD